MIACYKGNVFNTKMQTLVITVNTMGVMGKGIALECKKRYPKLYSIYKRYCNALSFKIGNLITYRNQDTIILLFPTKEHWSNDSKLEWIETGLKLFVKHYEENNIQSICFPPLGCGNGNLDFDTQVKPLMYRYLESLPIPVEICY